MADPLVSVIVPVYNGAATLERALESALAQRLDETFEVIAVDDESTDATPEILHAYRDRVRKFLLPRQGPSAARNAAAAIARGRYLAFLDADDVWLAGFLAKTVGALRDSPSSALAFADIVPVDNLGRRVDDFVDPKKFVGTPTLEDLLARWWPILTSAVVMRREVFERCGGFPEEFRVPGYEDPWLWMRAREHGDFQRVAEPLVLYRTTPQPERIEKYAAAFQIFARLAEQRYGASARGLVDHLRSSYVSALGYKGLLAMCRGDKRAARREFIRALRYDPLSVRTMLRLARTFLPMSVALAMTGRARLTAAPPAVSVFPAAKRVAPE